MVHIYTHRTFSLCGRGSDGRSQMPPIMQWKMPADGMNLTNDPILDGFERETGFCCSTYVRTAPGYLAVVQQ